ncbi:acyl-CoA dehydratase activase-related protein [Neomoorella thermoacetica]|uniref:Uncharacterized protein conserved in bacteria n=2 Tax=Neomoorella thermoacetica TaxID=1525 RepID=A0A0S6UC05_NEOTH|nr:acyl-CoA dehydratase activase-related protein [Moorella thermoacetica]AKX97182.1 2-hydroxyglutaryl-CoA dehydratase, D-component [Moorella thermoacetica]OIQ55113.1 2-hydroxyglutaryl-CoA dehydratase, D-component [Moorella thermoacetica]OIQ57399.1 2-hydroxyglutaryl-CoA dehydratase, D-component [Moorella thermoacetica]QDA01013.1 2-hydroxyglutaryl-CoA dehydratase, D-component [Moorella thermoacetica]TYL10169.1 hypothetical protein MOOCA_07680 [Moorella thermoacetica]
MSYRVGIPRGLSYYYLFPFMQGFLTALGVEVVVSPPTDAVTLAAMNACPTDEPCVSVKLYFAHAKRLVESGVDYLFIPVLSSVEKDNYCCPKLIGAAAMIRNGLGLAPEQVLAPEWNEREKPGAWRENLLEIAARLGAGPERAAAAIRAGLEKQAACERMARQGLTLPLVYHRLCGTEKPRRQQFDPEARYDEGETIAVLGHPYLLYDGAGHQIVERLAEYARVITPEMVPPEDYRPEVATIFEGTRMWAYEARILGAGFSLLRKGQVTKMVLVEAFECGPASVIESYLEAEAERFGVPFLLLTVDEHTGEAGLVTRLEAFVDTSGSRPVNPAGKKQAFFFPASRGGELKVGAPGMGLLDIALEAVLQECRVEMVPTPPVTKRTVELGKELAPEFICYPLVTTLGQIREVLEQGANTIVMVGGKGRCRLGWYAQVQELLLKRLGRDFHLVIIDSPLPWRERWPAFRQALKEITNNAPLWRIIQGIYLGYHKMAALDQGEAMVRRKRAYESQRGAADKAWRRFVGRVKTAAGVRSVKRVFNEFREELAAIPEVPASPLRVKIIGEIYTVLEGFVNQEIEQFLASREDLRVEVVREITATQWFNLNVLHRRYEVERHRAIVTAAAPYLDVSVGGHGQESVGEAVLAAREGYDGVIQLLPFTCMPEIVAQNILVPLSEKLDLPFLSLIINEQNGTAGWETRLEAFLEVLAERREKLAAPGGEKHGVLFGY